MKLNVALTKAEQISLTSDVDYDSITMKDSYRHASNYLPDYVKEAMKKNGVIRDINGNFVKVGVDKTK